jgi:two-component system chemotaxis response regulator CheY
MILIDLNLPVMDGKELLHHVRAIPEYKITPVLVVSDKGDIDTIRQVKLYDGAKGFLIKENVTPQQTIATLLDLM